MPRQMRLVFTRHPDNSLTFAFFHYFPSVTPPTDTDNEIYVAITGGDGTATLDLPADEAAKLAAFLSATTPGA